MYRRFRFKELLFTILLLILLISGATVHAYADSSASIISGRLAATYDGQTGTVTAMVAGYCEGEAVTIGPSTWAVTAREFSQAKAEDIGNTLCGKDFSLKRVLKSTNNGKEIVAEVLIVRPETSMGK